MSATSLDEALPEGARAVRFALLVGFVLLAYGLLSNSMLQQMGVARLRDGAWFALATLVGGWLLARASSARLVPAWIVILGALHVLMVGIAPALATLLVALAAIALGSRLVPGGVASRLWVCLVVGLGLLTAICGWLLPYGVHRMPVYVLACLLLIGWRWAAVLELLREQRAAWRAARGQAAWERPVAIGVIAYCATSAWLPTAQFDDLVYHLGLPWQLATLGHYRFDVQSQVWSVAPWAADVAQALVQVIARSEGRGALNSLWLLACLHLLWGIGAGLGLAPRWRWLALALFASQPMAHGLLQSMQTELPMATVVLAAALLVLDSVDAPSARSRLRAFAVLAGFALALKLSAVPFVTVLGAWYLLRARGVAARALPVAALLFFVVGGSSYVYAAVLTGDPLLPLFNDIFRSPYFPIERFFDSRYGGLLSWRAPYDLVIHGGRFFEGGDGVVGFQWLALLPVLLLGCAFRASRGLVAVALICAVVLFTQMQYSRYLFPALALASMALLAVPALAGAGLGARLAVAVLAVLNVAALNSAIWNVRRSGVDLAWRSGFEIERAYLREMVPERLLIRHVRERYGDTASVLFLEAAAPYAAELAGHGLGDTWYDPSSYSRAFHAQQDESGAAYRELFDTLGATHVIVHPDQLSPALRAALAQAARLELNIGNADLYRIEREGLALEGWPSDAAALRSGALDLSAPAPSDQPLVVDFEAQVSCAPAGAAIAARLLAQVGPAQPQRASDYELCPPSGTMRLQGFGRMRGTERIVLRIEPGAALPLARFAPGSVRVTARPDIATARDFSKRLRP